MSTLSIEYLASLAQISLVESHSVANNLMHISSSIDLLFVSISGFAFPHFPLKFAALIYINRYLSACQMFAIGKIIVVPSPMMIVYLYESSIHGGWKIFLIRDSISAHNDQINKIPFFLKEGMHWEGIDRIFYIRIWSVKIQRSVMPKSQRLDGIDRLLTDLLFWMKSAIKVCAL